jgi:hypothetical protein
MGDEEFLNLAASITSTVAIKQEFRDITPALVIAISAANAFNAGANESRRLLTLARAQLPSGSIMGRLAAELRSRARQRAHSRAELIAKHHPLLC